MGAIAKYLIDRPLATNLISLVLIVLGIFSFFKLNRQATPLVDMDQMRITAIVPAASPADIELSVTRKLEEALEGVSGIQRHFSHSSEGRSTIEIFIDPETPDKEKVKTDIRQAIDSVQDLPEEMLDRPQIMEIRVDEIVVYELAIVFDEYDPARISSVARDLKRRLLDFDEISKVINSSIPEREVHIKLDPQKLRQYQVGIDEVIHAIQENKIRLSGGMLEAEDRERSIVTISDFDNPKDIAQLVIRSTAGGRRILIGDIATVVDSFADQESIAKYNGKQGGSLMIKKKASADIIRLVEKIEALKTSYMKNAPSDMQLISTWDFSVNTRVRLDIVSSNLAAGFVLVLIILFLFLDFRIALWTSLGIPIAIAGALIFMPMADVTINSVSLCGMILVLGMIVDDAIIIAESVYRKIEEGLPGNIAALDGMREVIKPVFGTIVTSIIAFVPLYFLPGMIGDFAVEVPTVVNIMLAASFFEAALILPSHLAHRRERKKGNIRPTIPPGQKLIKVLQGIYARFLTVCLRHRWMTTLLITLLAGSGFAVALKWTRFQMFDLSQASRIYLMGEVKEGASLAYTEKQVDQLEAIISKLPADILMTYKSSIGVEGSFKGARYASRNSFLTEIVLTPFTERDFTAEQVTDYVLGEVRENLAGSFKTLDVEIDSEGPPVGRPLEVRISGDERQVRYQIIDEILTVLKSHPVSEVVADNSAEKDALHLIPDYPTLARAGVSVAQIANTVRAAVDGVIVSHLQTPVERVPFRIMVEGKDHDFKDPLAGLLVRNQFGNLIPIKGIMQEEVVRTPRKILHYNGHPSNMITANVKKGSTAAEVYQSLDTQLEELRFRYPGFSIEIAGEAKESDKFMNDIIILLALAIMGIYCWLVLQLNSLIQPFMVVLAIPFGLLGVLLAFIVHGYNLSLLALVGVVGVGGVLVNDSLIMVEFINRLRTTHTGNWLEAIVEGASHRFRPIMLTTVTTVIGLLPTAYGIFGGTDAFISPLVFTMTWGLLIGTPSVLIVIPTLYALYTPKSPGLATRPATVEPS